MVAPTQERFSKAFSFDFDEQGNLVAIDIDNASGKINLR